MDSTEHPQSVPSAEISDAAAPADQDSATADRLSGLSDDDLQALAQDAARSTAEAIAEQKRRVFEGLAPEIQANPAVRARFGVAPVTETRFGLGDAVAKVAGPIARLIGRDPNCEPCRRRRAALNRMASVKLPKRRTRGPL